MWHTTHVKKGNNGQYFHFDEKTFDYMVGHTDWNRKTFDIIQRGSRIWSGSVKVWRATSDYDAHGRRNQDDAENRWSPEDTLVMKNCGRKL